MKRRNAFILAACLVLCLGVTSVSAMSHGGRAAARADPDDRTRRDHRRHLPRVRQEAGRLAPP